MGSEFPLWEPRRATLCAGLAAAAWERHRALLAVSHRITSGCQSLRNPFPFSSFSAEIDTEAAGIRGVSQIDILPWNLA